MKKAFTIIELILAMALLTSLLVTSGIVFRVAVKSYMTATATAEISRKLRGITDQLNEDFKGLRKDAEIFIAWVPNPVYKNSGAIDRYERFDRISFFADGDFQSYNEWPMGTSNIITGNTARISYMLAGDPSGDKAQSQKPHKRILARSQHIISSDPRLVDVSDPTDPAFPPDPADPAYRRIRWIDPSNIRNQLFPSILGVPDFTGAFTVDNNNHYEYDNLTLSEWLYLPWIDKREMLTTITSIRGVQDPDARFVVVADGGGLVVDTDTPTNVHELLCQGVGEFSIQGYYVDIHPVTGLPWPRWFPQIDPDGDKGYLDSDFISKKGGSEIDPNDIPGLLYPYDPFLSAMEDPLDRDMHGVVRTQNVVYPQNRMIRENFNAIPGLGRAFKFTFTLYDSRGIFKRGKKFTHIVYLDEK